MKMKLRDRRVGLLVLTVLVFVSQTAQTPLRPLVMRANEPRGAAPTECAEGLSDTPVPPRIEVAEIPIETEPADAPPPPSSTLRGELEAVQNALVRNDRPAFDENLARVRQLVAGYPPGGERTAAEEALRIYSDAARLWDAQYTAPFFGEGSPEYESVSRYPGYAEAVRRATFTDERGNRFYPAAESREFLAGIAAQRLQRLGIRTTTPAPRVTRTQPAAPLPTVVPAKPRRTTESATRTTPRSTTTRSTTKRSTTPRSSSSSSTRSTTPRSTTASSSSSSTVTRKPAAATPTPGKPNPSAPPTAAAVPAPATTAGTSSPAAGGSATTDTNDTPPANVDAPTSTSTHAWTDTTPTDRPSATPVDTDPNTDTATTAGADTAFSPTPMTDTATGSAAPSTTTSETAPAPKRPVFLATILILIGLGVLIVLFRASR